MNTQPKRQIFGRQPVVWIAAIQALLTLLVSFHALKDIGINGPDDVMLVAGVLNAVGAAYLAFGTTETMLATLIEVFKAGAAFAAIYGLNLTGEQSGVAVLTITALFSLVVHQPKTSPQATLSLTPGAVLLAPETASPTYDAQDAGGVVSRGEQGNVSVGYGVGALVTLVVFFMLGLFLTAMPANAAGGNLWHSSPDTGYAEPFHVYCQNTGLKLVYAGQGANGPACEAFLQVQVVDGQEIWCYQSYQWTKWLDATGTYNVSGSRSCESRAD